MSEAEFKRVVENVDSSDKDQAASLSALTKLYFHEQAVNKKDQIAMTDAALNVTSGNLTTSAMNNTENVTEFANTMKTLLTLNGAHPHMTARILKTRLVSF